METLEDKIRTEESLNWQYKKGKYFLNMHDKQKGLMWINMAASDGYIKAMCEMMWIRFKDSFVIIINDNNLEVNINKENLGYANAILEMIRDKRNDTEDKTDIDEDCSKILYLANEMIVPHVDNRSYDGRFRDALITLKILSFFADHYDGPLQETAIDSMEKWKNGVGNDTEFGFNRVKDILNSKIDK